ncbi:Serine--tRNA ligase, mitochondrial [Maublancomyces gigas]|uniref:serine--tRNA ligase n=1 Tax=Discina gigas TaxID=1032678 RepID=A0ABR3GX68_9PEZI
MVLRIARHASICRTPPRCLLSTTPVAKQGLHPTAPKPTPSLRSIRESAEYHRQNCLDRNYPTSSTAPAQIVSLHEELTALRHALKADREQHHALTSLLKKRGSNTPAEEQNEAAPKQKLLLEAKALKDKITAVEEKEKSLESEMRTLALSLPNHTHSSTPIGTEPKVLGYINEHLAQTDWGAKKPHTDVGAELGLLDFTSASTVSGWGWYYLLDDAVLLEQALVNYALTLARGRGWRLVSPPSIVYSHIASAAGFRPRDQHGEQQIYALEVAEGKFSHSLVGTAEIPLAGLGANRVFGEDELPLKVVGTGRAYRAEAGARGVESKGLYRVHEFTKVELFAWAPPDPAFAEQIFNEMLVFQTDFITSLGLYARILEMPTTDLGASAHRKIDIEVYIPSREKKDPWGEVSSLSNCTDYQSRRLNTRAKLKGGTRDFAWTLNGTAVAVPRILIALLEYGYVEGSVRVPEVLRPFMGGQDIIVKRK